MAAIASAADAFGPDDLLQAIAVASGLEFWPVLPVPSPDALAALPRTVAVGFSVVPFVTEPEGFLTETELCIATSEPLNFDLLDRLRFLLRREIRIVVAPTSEIRRVIAEFYPSDAS